MYHLSVRSTDVVITQTPAHILKERSSYACSSSSLFPIPTPSDSESYNNHCLLTRGKCVYGARQWYYTILKWGRGKGETWVMDDGGWKHYAMLRERGWV